MSDLPAANPAEALDASIATLRAAFPEGVRITPDAVISEEKPKVLAIDFTALMQRSRATRRIEVMLDDEQPVSFEVRGLTSSEQADVDQFFVTPPKKKVRVVKDGKPIEEEVDDLENPAFVKESVLSAKKRRAMTISIGMIGAKEAMQTQLGANMTVEQMMKFLEDNFTPRVLDTIYSGISHLTREPIRHASFI